MCFVQTKLPQCAHVIYGLFCTKEILQKLDVPWCQCGNENIAKHPERKYKRHLMIFYAYGDSAWRPCPREVFVTTHSEEGGEVTRRASGSVVSLVSLSLSQFSKNHQEKTESSTKGNEAVRSNFAVTFKVSSFASPRQLGNVSAVGPPRLFRSDFER